MSDLTVTRPNDYAPLSKALHWITAVIVLGLIPAGIVMTNIGPGALQNSLFDWHRSFGVLVFTLAIVRLATRIAHGAPPAHAGLTRFERAASAATHHTMYLLLIAMPIIGWLMTSAYRVDVSVFGLFTLPHLQPQSDEAFALYQRLHFFGGLLMALLVAMHIGAVIKHTFLDKDTVLWRMLPKSWGG
jgi:cytochrome b561